MEQREKSKTKPVRQEQPGDELVMAGYMALAGTAAAVRSEWDILQKRLPEAFLQNILEQEKEQTARILALSEEVLSGVDFAGSGLSAWHRLGEAGIYRGLWEEAGRRNMGFLVRLSALPVRQETIEVCEILEMNPYSLNSQGCLLLSALHGGRLCRCLEELGWPAAVVGEWKAGNEKTLIHGTVKSCLNRPEEDEWLRFLRRKEGKPCTSRQEKEEESRYA